MLKSPVMFGADFTVNYTNEVDYWNTALKKNFNQFLIESWFKKDSFLIWFRDMTIHKCITSRSEIFVVKTIHQSKLLLFLIVYGN